MWSDRPSDDNCPVQLIRADLRWAIAHRERRKDTLQQTELMQVSDVRGIVSHLLRDEPVSQGLVEKARDTVLVMLQQGAENGLTPAEIIRAALAPV